MIEITKYSDIPGLGNFNLLYKELVSTLPPNASILEVGIGYGRGTWAMLDAMTEHMTLDVIDVFNNPGFYKTVLQDGLFPRTLTPKNYKKLSKRLSNTPQKEIFTEIISQHPKFFQLTNIYEMLSRDYISQNKKNDFDLVFLDADHSYEAISRELEYFKDCAVITGHDYNNNFPGIMRAVEEFLKTHRDRKLTTFDDQCVFIIKKN
jgi:hypothetical protein